MLKLAVPSKFKTESIETISNKIDSICFNTNRNMFYHSDNHKYITEEIIAKTAVSDYEQQICIWLWRIERYFYTKEADTSKNSKDRTSQLIVDFLDKFIHLPEGIQHFLCTNNSIRNCLFFTLLQSQNKTQWEAVIEILNNNNFHGALRPILFWCYDFYFNQAYEDCENVLEQINLLYNKNKSPEFKIAKSPITTVFALVAVSNWYANNPQQVPTNNLATVLPFGNVTNSLVIMPYMIELSLMSDQLTHSRPLIKQQISIWNNHFLEKFRLRGIKEKETLPVFYSERFRIFLGSFIETTLEKVDKIDEKEQLIGLARLIVFYDPKPYFFHSRSIQKGTALARKLFTLQLYTEAYELYDDLIAFQTEYESTEKKKARSALYCFVSKIDPWLNGKTKLPAFTTEEERLLTHFPLIQSDLIDEVPTVVLYRLAIKLGTKFQSGTQETTADLCVTYYKILKPILFHKSLLNTDQHAKLERLFGPKQEIHKNLEVVPVHVIATKATVLADSLPQELESTPIQSQVPVARLVSNQSPKSPVDSDGESADISETEVIIKPSVPRDLRFFAPLAIIPDSQMKFSDKSIGRAQIKPEVMRLLDTLIDQFPLAEFYLTGAAPADILDSNKPNDYDIVTVNLSLPDLHAFFLSQNVQSDLRGKKNPILFCDLGIGITLDFTSKMFMPNETIEALLYRDFQGRDFTNNALYCKFTKADEFQIFSFASALKNREEKIIDSIPNAEVIFEQDITRLFRLVKLIIKQPEYQLSGCLQKALDNLRSSWVFSLRNYTNASTANRLRLDHVMKKLFARAQYVEINQAFDRLGILNAFTRNSLEDANLACAKIQVFNDKYKMLYWIAANILQGYTKGKTQGYSPLHNSLLLTLQERDYLLYINGKCPGRTAVLHYCAFDIVALVSAFELEQNDTNANYLSFK
ncbi:MAG: hypothetical protein WC627_11885 [Legionella sp.]|jgi:tRNA nucleotidyltransferase/poly(A) polymerase